MTSVFVPPRSTPIRIACAMGVLRESGDAKGRHPSRSIAGLNSGLQADGPCRSGAPVPSGDGTGPTRRAMHDMDGDRLRLAMQRSGRLSEASFELLAKCGLHIARSHTELFCRVQELPIDLLLVRDDDIPGFVEEGVCDIGIVGDNVMQEQRLSAKRPLATQALLELGYARCRLVLAVPEEMAFTGLG